MSELNNPDARARADQSNDEDPLAELARIVSGKEDKSDVPAPATNPVSAVPVQNATNLDEFGSDLESQLMRELGAPGLDDANAYATTKPAVVPPPKPANDVAPTAQEAADVPAFHDELLEALNAELHPAATAGEAPVEATVAPSAPLPPETTPVAQAEQAPAAPPVPVEEAFKAEFEQLIENNAEPQEDQADQKFAVATDALREELAPRPEDTAKTPDLDFEAQFGATFAEELGAATLGAEEPGAETLAPDQAWNAGDTVEAGNDFARAAVPASGHGPVTIPGELGDPGHADDLSHLNPDPAHPVNIPAPDGSRRYAIIALVLALVTGLAAAGYGFFGSQPLPGGKTPIIKADSGPLKIKPADPGGRQIANQDKASYEKVEGSQNDGQSQSSLISNTEEPADLSSGQTATLEPKSDDRLLADNGEPEPAAVGGVSPRKVKTVTVKPDGTIVLSEPETVAEALPGRVGAAAGQAVPNIGIAAAQSIDGASASGDVGVPSASPLPKPTTLAVAPPAPPKPVEVASISSAVAATPTSASLSANEWVVQVSSQRSPEAAQASFQNLQRRFASVFNGREAGIQRAVIKDKGTFYRVRVKTASKNDASQFCSQFKAAGGSCFITR